MAYKVEMAELRKRVDALEIINKALTEENKELERKEHKKDVLLKMCRGREKQYTRDENTVRRIYNDLIDDMMNRQIGMAACGWDKYHERKKAKRKGKEEFGHTPYEEEEDE